MESLEVDGVDKSVLLLVAIYFILFIYFLTSLSY